MLITDQTPKYIASNALRFGDVVSIRNSTDRRTRLALLINLATLTALNVTHDTLILIIVRQIFFISILINQTLFALILDIAAVAVLDVALNALVFVQVRLVKGDSI